MSDVVWVSNAMNDPRLTKALTTDIAAADMSRAIDAANRNHVGEPLGRSYFPKQVFPNGNGAPTFKKVPHFFFAGSYWVISKSVADVLSQFDLGAGGLYPVEVFQKKDCKTRIEGEFFCLNFGNVKRAFLQEKSSERLRKAEGPLRFYMPFVPENDQIAVSKESLVSPDIWIEPVLRKTFFISDRLRTALKKAKVDGAFRLFKCRVV